MAARRFHGWRVNGVDGTQRSLPGCCGRAYAKDGVVSDPMAMGGGEIECVHEVLTMARYLLLGAFAIWHGRRRGAFRNDKHYFAWLLTAYCACSCSIMG